MTSERLPPQAHAALLESSCVSKRRILVMDEGQLRMKPRGGTLTFTQQAKRKLVVHFLGKVLPPYRSEILQRVRGKRNRSGRFFLQSFYKVFLRKAPFRPSNFDICTMRRQLTALRPQEYETLLWLETGDYSGQAPGFRWPASELWSSPRSF